MVIFLSFYSFLHCSLGAVPSFLNYSRQVVVNGYPFDRVGFFKFALINSDGNFTHWSNDGSSAVGSEPDANVSESVHGGLYFLLLGNGVLQ